MDTFLQDLRHAVRMLGKAPAFTAVAIATLALGIGANTSVFSAIDAVLLRPLPYREPDRLMMLYLTKEGQAPGDPSSIPWSYPKFATFRGLDHPFAAAAGFTEVDLTLGGAGGPERLRGEMVSAAYFPVLGVAAERGRTFQAEEDAEPGARPVVLLSHELWQRRFGGDPGVVGRAIQLNRSPFTVAGVLPAGFRGLSGTAEAWVPMAMAGTIFYPGALEERWAHWFDVVARLEPGIAPATAAAAMPALGKAVDAAHTMPQAHEGSWSARAVSLHEARIEPAVERSMLVLWGAVGFVLLIACVNLANLLLARSAARQREVAVRVALGAGRRRLVRQLLTESLLLSLLGGLAGLGVAALGNRALAAIRPAAAGWNARAVALQGIEALALDGRVLLFALGLALLTGLLFGLVPALHSSRPDLTGALKSGAAGALTGGSLARMGTRGLLVAGEIALALVLLAGAGLMLQSFARLRGVDPGFEPERLLSFRLDPPEPFYTRDNAPAFKERLLARLAVLPGVSAVSTDYCPPLAGGCNRTIVTRVDDTTTFASGEGPEIGVHSVGPDYFRTIGAPVVAGRAFTPADREGAPIVALVNQAAARKLWPGQSPLGRRIAVGVGLFRDDATAEVVGVVGDVKYGTPDEVAGPEIYVSYLQYTSASGVYLLRTRTEPEALVAALRREVRAIDPDLPVFDVETMAERISEATSTARFGASLLAAFAALALALAAVGIYGVMSYTAAQRSKEMGLRLALGAQRREVLGLMVGQGAVLAALGIAAGLAAALALARLMESLLYDVEPTDPATFAAIALLLGGTALLASYLPARRLQKVDPAVVLKSE